MKITTALTGFIVPKCKIYGNGFFSNDTLDPDVFGKEIDSLRKALECPSITARKLELDYIKSKKLKRFIKHDLTIIDGKILIHRKSKLLKNKDDNLIVIAPHNKPKGYRKTYKNEYGIPVDEYGHIVIKRRHELPKEGKLFKISDSGKSIKPKPKLIKIHRK